MHQESPIDAVQWLPKAADGIIWAKGWETLLVATKEKMKAVFSKHAADIDPLNDEYLHFQLNIANGGKGPPCLTHGMFVPNTDGGNVGLLLLPEQESEDIVNAMNPVLRLEVMRETFWHLIMHMPDEDDGSDWEMEAEAECTDEEEAGRRGKEGVSECGAEGTARQENEDKPDDDDDDDDESLSTSIPEIASYRANGGDVVETNEDDYEEREEERDADYADVSDDEMSEDLSEMEPEPEDKDALLNPEEDPDYIRLANRDPRLRELYVALVTGKFHYEKP